eukprot:1826030-Amphidinium_carterae.1
MSTRRRWCELDGESVANFNGWLEATLRDEGLEDKYELVKPVFAQCSPTFWAKRRTRAELQSG